MGFARAMVLDQATTRGTTAPSENGARNGGKDSEKIVARATCREIFCPVAFTPRSAGPRIALHRPHKWPRNSVRGWEYVRLHSLQQRTAAVGLLSGPRSGLASMYWHFKNCSLSSRKSSVAMANPSCCGIPVSISDNNAHITLVSVRKTIYNEM